jgi:hypothetical protein
MSKVNKYEVPVPRFQGLAFALVMYLDQRACGYLAQGSRRQPAGEAPLGGDPDHPRVLMVVALYNETPQHRDNFLKLVREGGFYDSLFFHRVIPTASWCRAATRTVGAMPRLGTPGQWRPIGLHLASPRSSRAIPQEGALAAARQPDQVNPTLGKRSQQRKPVLHRAGQTIPTKEELDPCDRSATPAMGTPVTYDRRPAPPKGLCQ